MMHALTPAADLDVSVRARRLACVLDPALLLAAPHALLLARQLARGVDLWVCPAFWRLLDASEFFVRRPQRLREWLGLPVDHPAQAVATAVDAWSRWRVTRDLTALGLYWVGGHQTESFLPESGPRDLPLRFEALMEAWLRADAADDGDEAPRPPSNVTPLPPRADYAGEAIDDAPGDAVAEREAPAERHDGLRESAALSVALQAPVLTLAADGDAAPGLVRQWAQHGLAGSAWHVLHPASAAGERERWWTAAISGGAAATVAAASAVGVRLALAQVVAPGGQLLGEASSAWSDEFAGGDDWALDALVPRGLPAAGAAPPWWRDAQALWTGL